MSAVSAAPAAVIRLDPRCGCEPAPRRNPSDGVLRLPRGIPQRAGGQQSHYVFGGKAEIVFSAYAFNQDELDLFKQEMQKSDLEDVLKLVSGTTDSLGQLQEEINSFLEEKSKDAKKKEARGSEEINPFFAAFGYYNVSSDERESMRDLPLKDKMRQIFGFGKKPEEKKEKKDIKNIRRDDWIEGTHLRKLAADAAKETTFDIFDIYKKQHGMPSYT